MAAFELSVREAATLINALESYLSDLSTERIGTDNREFRGELKEREAVLGEIMKRLKTVT